MSASGLGRVDEGLGKGLSADGHTTVKELGWFIPEGEDPWSSKFHKGPYIYSNDILRGFDVYKITAQ